MLESRSIEGDDVHAKLVAAIEKPERAHLWVPADAIEFTPRVLPRVYGDGRALFALATINQRPAYWVIRACSTWGSGLDRGDAPGPDFAEFTDEILTDLEEAFGNGRCGYSGESLFYPKSERSCDCEECQDDYIAAWPEVDGYGGCSWSRIDWPEGFEVVPHPLSGMGNLLAPPPPPQTNVVALEEQVAFTLSDASRLLRKQDVEGACPNPDDCFYFGDRVRCGPCAVKASAAKGIVVDDTHSHLPEVCRLRRELRTAMARIAELEVAPAPQPREVGQP